ncbi:pyridoxamine kinase [Peptostreptococcus faecalis]|uniref:pyridoxamine kinase n=1 Tax=Peptostreptococcus faecalis TaxID=2045015 RepID=UPI000C7CC981|nr:pyridoxamine kinase [Peptostreptococcus faecalis]
MQKKIACINDISGIGKCSLTVALPIISALKCQCCPLPTSVLSSQTGYPKYTFTDLTDGIDEYINTWSELGQTFDTIYSGFLSSSKQINLVHSLINKNKSAFVVVDPVLADHGILFPIFTENDIIDRIKLISKADLITPNLTEANLLTGRQPNKLNYTDSELLSLCKDLTDLGPNSIIVTGFESNSKIYNICYQKGDKSISKIGIDYNKVSFSGTGDIFTSIVTAMMTRGFDIEKSVTTATSFIYDAVAYTVDQGDYDRNDGIIFEYFLDRLTKL